MKNKKLFKHFQREFNVDDWEAFRKKKKLKGSPRITFYQGLSIQSNQSLVIFLVSEKKELHHRDKKTLIPKLFQYKLKHQVQIQ